MKIDLLVIRGLTFKRAVELRKDATMFFDQFRVGFYGNSAIEAMQFGIPTAAWISPEAIKQAGGALEGCPVITMDKDADLWVDTLADILSDSTKMEELSVQNKEWCDKMHSYQAIAKQWKKIYHAIQGKTQEIPRSPRDI
jgi:glycosyltransferase involved in cell wall biosynthesis